MGVRGIEMIETPCFNRSICWVWQTSPNFPDYWCKNIRILMILHLQKGEWREAEIRPQIYCCISVSTFNESEALLSSLMTDDRASGLIPCSQRRTHIDKDSMSNPVFRSLDISRRTENERSRHISRPEVHSMINRYDSPQDFLNLTIHSLPDGIHVCARGIGHDAIVLKLFNYLTTITKHYLSFRWPRHVYCW